MNILIYFANGKEETVYNIISIIKGEKSTTFYDDNDEDYNYFNEHIKTWRTV